MPESPSTAVMSPTVSDGSPTVWTASVAGSPATLISTASTPIPIPCAAQRVIGCPLTSCPAQEANDAADAAIIRSARCGDGQDHDQREQPDPYVAGGDSRHRHALALLSGAPDLVQGDMPEHDGDDRAQPRRARRRRCRRSRGPCSRSPGRCSAPLRSPARGIPAGTADTAGPGRTAAAAGAGGRSVPAPCTAGAARPSARSGAVTWSVGPKAWTVPARAGAGRGRGRGGGGIESVMACCSLPPGDARPIDARPHSLEHNVT